LSNTDLAPNQGPRPVDIQHALSVAVVVPTYNRAVPLADTLESLIAQDYEGGAFEIVVIDDGPSTDSTARVVADVRQRSPFPVTYYRQGRSGPAAARNHGVARTKSDVVGFTDSDCRVDPDWISKAMRRMTEDVAFVAGPVRPVVNPKRPPGFFAHQIANYQDENLVYPTANVFYRREVLLRVGGFDERFGSYPWGVPMPGEDTDLAWRARRAGFKSAWAPDAPVFHEASRIRILNWLVDPIRLTVVPRLVAHVPELRKDLLLRLFVSPQNAAFYPALFGVGASFLSGSPLLLALAAPWLWLTRWEVMRDVWPPLRWWRIPLKYALMLERYLFIAATLLCASARYRRLVL
jgi:glycosyltransferase involved in cell wall biosynthesis